MKPILEQLETRCTPAVITISGVDSGDIDGTPFATAYLTGTEYDDTIIFQNGAYLTGALDGGGGDDTVTFAAWSDAFAFSVGFAGVGNNAGDIAGTFGTLPFTSVGNLTSGSGDDTFAFAHARGVTGVIDAGGGTDLFDLSAYTTNTRVNLTTGVTGMADRAATGVHNGNANGLLGVENVSGGSRDDRIWGDGGANVLTGNAGNDVLIGFAGADTLSGGSGRNVLVGGLGADTLTADAASTGDILIAGYTSHDSSRTALDAVMSEWGSVVKSYTLRTNNLKNVNAYKLRPDSGTSPTVFGDGAANTLQGNSGSVKNWYFAGPSDSLTGNFAGELVEALL